MNKNQIIIAVLVAIIIIGGYLFYKESQTETLSMNIGGKEISATVEK